MVRRKMFGLSSSELLFYGGIIIILLAVIAAGICSAIFLTSGKKLKRQLEKEYGKPRH